MAGIGALSGRLVPIALRLKRKQFLKRNRELYAKRRASLHGWPHPERPFTRAEIEDYYSGDRIVCLICGKPFKALGGSHLKVHDLDGDKYREMYGLPFTKGLIPDSRSDALSKAVSDEARVRLRALSNTAQKKAAEVARGRPIRRAPFARHETTERINRVNGMDGAYTIDDFKAVCDVIKTGVKLDNLFGNEQFGKLISKTTFWKLHKNSQQCRDLLEATYESMPFAEQARHQKLGKAYERTVAEMHATGMSDHKIAAALGVTAMSVNKITKPIRASRPGKPRAPAA